MWEILRDQIYRLLDTNKGDLGLQEVHRSSKLNFSGYPSASTYMSDSPSDYETTSENLRTYVFKVMLVHEIRKGGLEEAENILVPVVDKVMDLLDQEAVKSSDIRIVGVNLPSDKVYIDINAVPGFWGQIDSEGLLVSQITVGIRISVDIS